MPGGGYALPGLRMTIYGTTAGPVSAAPPGRSPKSCRPGKRSATGQKRLTGW
nr:MAG TPA: hypothetical protein [Caudoviricetes sp.]